MCVCVCVVDDCAADCLSIRGSVVSSEDSKHTGSTGELLCETLPDGEQETDSEYVPSLNKEAECGYTSS